MAISRIQRNRICIGLVGALLLLASSVSARTITVRWTQVVPPDVQGFEVFVGTSPGTYGPAIDLGALVPSAGVYEAQLVVPESDVYVALAAYNAEGSSPLSNAEIYVVPGTQPPPPDPDPTPTPGGGAQAAVTGFALVSGDKDNLAVLDAPFSDGDAISLATHGECVSIQVLVNPYLDRGGSPGSVRLEFDGEVPVCNDKYVTHDNGPPYLFRQTTTGCTNELAAVGSHTLTATPFDGDACTGASGTPVSVDFQVVGDPVASDPGDALSAPGRPFIVD